MNFIFDCQVSKKLMNILINGVKINFLNFFLVETNREVVENINENFDFINNFVRKSF